jgi:hypothetical protein
MSIIRLIFFSLLTHLAIGALLPLLFISVNEIGTRFFRFVCGLSIGLFILAFLIKPFTSFSFSIPFVRQSQIDGQITTLSVASIFFILLTIFFLNRDGKIYLTLAVACGLAAMAKLAFMFPNSSDLSRPADWMMASSFMSSALMLGSVLGTMITGHWYLVNHKLTIRPLQTATWIFIGVTGLRSLLVIAIVLLLGFSQMAQAETARNLLGFSAAGILFWARVAFGLVTPLIFGMMVWGSVRVRNTQSATGILYATIILVLVGEVFSKYLFWFTGIPV